MIGIALKEVHEAQHQAAVFQVVLEDLPKHFKKSFHGHLVHGNDGPVVFVSEVY